MSKQHSTGRNPYAVSSGNEDDDRGNRPAGGSRGGGSSRGSEQGDRGHPDSAENQYRGQYAPQGRDHAQQGRHEGEDTGGGRDQDHAGRAEYGSQGRYDSNRENEQYGQYPEQNSPTHDQQPKHGEK